MREDVLAIVGGNFYYQVETAVQFRDAPVVWFTRDPDGRTMVNTQMLTTSGEPRMVMLENVWITEGSAERTIVCPPSGRQVHASYPNSDELRIEFRELASVDDLDRHYPKSTRPGEAPRSHAETTDHAGITFPIAAVEITMNVGGTPVRFGPRSTSLPGGIITGGWMIRGRVGLSFR
jgi:hypothetical protein